MFERLISRFSSGGRLDRARNEALRTASGSLHDLLSVPLADPNTSVGEARLLALDLETTGLDPARDHLVSVGFVPVDGGVIDLSGAYHAVVASVGEVGHSATIHGLTDDAVASGSAVEAVLPVVLEALRGRILLAHFARIEVGFLSRACERQFGAPLVTQVVDTLELQRRIRQTPYGDPPAGSLRLPAARDAFSLSRYRGHDALTDALACAELYLAQAAHLSRGGPMTLASVLSPESG